MSAAQRDAASDRRAQALRDAGVPMREPLRQRDPAYVSAIFDGQAFIAEGQPARRCNQFKWWLNGEFIGIGGGEFAWRRIQELRAPLLGMRNA